VAGDELVTSPDQHRPSVSRRLARFGALISAILLVVIALVGNHQGHVEDIFTLGTAGLLVLILVVDWLMRRNGLKPDA
jgi:hydrogenase-4 membrane subunit HyfE